MAALTGKPNKPLKQAAKPAKAIESRLREAFHKAGKLFTGTATSSNDPTDAVAARLRAVAGKAGKLGK